MVGDVITFQAHTGSIKRDIAQLCLQDEADQLQQQAQQQAQQQLAAAAASGQMGSSGPRPIVPSKRRGFSTSSYDEDRPEDRAALAAATQEYVNGVAGPGPNSTPSPVRGTDLISNVPLPQISPQDQFRPLGGFADEMQQAHMAAAAAAASGGSVPQWYDPSSFQHALEKMDTPSIPGHTGRSGTTGATPDFSWSALVEGMLSEPGPQTPGEFAWLQNQTNGSGGTPSSSLMPHQQQGSTPGNANQTTSSNSNMSPSAQREFRPEMSLSPGSGMPGPDDPVEPFNYTFSYSRLRSFANELGNAEFQRRVSTATERFKPILHGCLSTYTDEQIVQSEVQFLTYVRNWQAFCETIPVPACVWRRTGEIYAANRRFVHMLDLQPDVIRRGRLATYMVR